MVRIFRREQRLSASVEANLVEMLKVRVSAHLFPGCHEVDRSRLLVDPDNVVDVPLPTRYAVLEAPGGEIVQVEMEPVLPLRPPDQLVRRRQHAPEILPE